MALFGKKKPDPGDEPSAGETGGGGQQGDGGSTAPDGGSGDGDDGFQPDPKKAKKWFDHGKTAADSYNYEYALTCYANGIKFDPEELAPHVAMYEAAVKFLNGGGKPAPGKMVKRLDGPHAVDKFAAAEFAWMRDLRSSSAAMRLIDTSVNSEQFEFGRWFAEKLINVLRQQKKPSKGDFVKAMRKLAEVGAWEHAIDAGNIASVLDPTDGELQAELKNFTAQRAMDQGGYAETAGEEGGYRKFIRDEDRQRELEEAESIAGSASIDERNLLRAQQEYEENPTNPDAINKYAQLIKKQPTPDAQDKAYEIYMRGFADTGEYRFRAGAGDIRITQAERHAEVLREKFAQHPDDLNLKADCDRAQQEVLALRLSELNERVEKYPTDRRLRFQLGEVHFALGNVEEAMASFQYAKEEPKLRVIAGHKLGLCFARDEWHDVAISELKEAIENLDASERDRELEIRYDLMISLIAQARGDSSIDLAKEALETCSTIMRKNVGYRDVRGRRKEIDTLVKELSEG